MLVKELIEKLQQLDPEATVHVAAEDCGCIYGYQEALTVQLLNLNTGESSATGSPVIMTYE